MQSPTLFPTLIVGSLAIGCRGDVDPLTEDDLAAMRELTAQFVQHARGNDWAALAELYTEDCVVMPAKGPAMHGRAAFRTWGEVFPPITAFDATIEEMGGYGDFAWARGTYTMAVQPDGAEEPQSDQGNWIEIRRRQPDGSWRIARDIFNSDVPLPDLGGQM